MGLLPWVRYTHILGTLIASLFIGSAKSRWNENGLCDVKPVSIWEPFCNEQVLYQPYVRVFHKGRNGALLRDRGPGFIDLSGLKDIYVCTNGLVMLYYEKTTAMGEVFERGELHWSAHTCELYNPSSNNGLKADFPKKCLLSILLIGHPQDYRMPAMQMFVAPLYDPKYGSYVNATSLIMIGDDGECLIEKGAERARLRVRLVRPPPPAPAPAKGGTRRRRKRDPDNKDAKTELEQAPIFCQLDVQRKLGQYKNIITLASPDTENPVKFEYPFRKATDAKPPAKPADTKVGEAVQEPDPPVYDPFRGTPFAKGGTGVEGKRETGSSINPRYSALEQILGSGAPAAPGGTATEPSEELKKLAEIADDVYTGLLADRKMRFIGCLRYPYFSREQLDIIFLKNDSLPDKAKTMAESELLKNNTPSATEGEGPEFWQKKVWKLPWPMEDPSIKTPEALTAINLTRFEHYLKDDGDIKAAGAFLPTTYQKLAFDLIDLENKTAQAKIKMQNTSAPKGDQETNKKDYNKENHAYMKAKVMLSLWPYKKAYALIRDQAQKVCEKAATMWEDLYKKVTGEESEMLRTTTAITPPSTEANKPAPEVDYLSKPPYDLAIIRKSILEKLSFTIYDRRFQPYNPKLVKEHEELEKQYVEVDKALRNKSVTFGPVISKIETMHSRCKMYKDLFVKSLVDLEGAIKHAERTQGPAPPMRGGDPFDKSFVDTNIDITDAKKAPELKEYYTPEDDEYEAAKACRELPAPKATCKAIKPTSIRAGQMLKNRKGKGPDFDTDDEWRDKIFDLMEKIFVKVCPYINEEFATAINRLVKGYLMGVPAGTGLEQPVNGSMLEIYNHHYQGIIYNDTYQRMNPSNFTVPKSTDETWIPKPKLNVKQEFWDYITQALEHCEEHATAMQFWHNEEGDKPAYVTFRKFFHNNNTEAHYDVEDLIMQEKADQEFAFNWAIDMNWRIFATVLGVCMPKYEFKIPLISARFYALYSQDFLSPLRQIWMSNRDNVILKLIMGNFYGACKGDKWAKICMESAFVESGDRSYRPPRYLYVNAFTEMNYFTTGPMAGTSGILNTVGNR